MTQDFQCIPTKLQLYVAQHSTGYQKRCIVMRSSHITRVQTRNLEIYTIAELFRLGISAVHGIIDSVFRANIKNLWQTSMLDHFPTNVQQFTEKCLILNSYGSSRIVMVL